MKSTKKSKIEISQDESKEIARLLMNYGLVLDVICSARNIPVHISEFVEKRRSTDFKKADARFERLMIKWCMAITSDKDNAVKKDSGPKSSEDPV